MGKKVSTGTTRGMKMFNPKTHKLTRKSSKSKGGSGMGGGF